MAKREEKGDPGLGMATLNEKGAEEVSNQKFAVPVGMSARDSLGDRVREMIRSEQLRREVLEQGYETFEEADDFDVEDDSFDPTTPYEEVFEGDMKTDLQQEAERRAKEEKERKRVMREEEFAKRVSLMSKEQLEKLLKSKQDAEVDPE